MNVQQAIADFLQHGQVVRNLSDRTLRAYNSDLSQFHVHMNGVNGVSGANMVEITPEHLEQYLDKLGTGPYRDTSIRRKVAALKVFFRYLEGPAHQIARSSGHHAIWVDLEHSTMPIDTAALICAGGGLLLAK